MIKRRISDNLSLLLIISLVVMGCGKIEFSTTAPTREVMDIPNGQQEEEQLDNSFLAENKNVDAVWIREKKADSDENAIAVFDELKRLNGDSLIITTNANGYITFLKGTVTEQIIDSVEDCKEVLKKLLPALTSNSEINLILKDLIEDNYGNFVIIFTESLEGNDVASNVVKIFLDNKGYMKGLSSFIVPYAKHVGKEISGQEAYTIVKDYLSSRDPDGKIKIVTTEPQKAYKYQLDPITLQEYYTEVYTVISNNPDSTTSVDAPFLEHYVSLSGEYLGANTAFVNREVDDERDFDILDEWFSKGKSLTFDADYDKDYGMQHTTSVPVTYAEGKYFLEDTERKILCADYGEFIYNKQIKVISSENNEDWNEDYIISYHNYIQCYDFYKNIEWPGPDGNGGPILILMDYKDENGDPINNLCYLGKFEKFDVFTGTTRANNYHVALDIIGHEYTHAVTAELLKNVIYKNETGSINEALSDIMGECIELAHLLDKGTPIESRIAFGVGAASGKAVRDLLNPELHGQPRFAGDINYVPSASIPRSLNDFGGVHINSSLISGILPKMYYETDADLEEIGNIWTTVTSMLTPGSGYKELVEILPLACEMSGKNIRIDTINEIINEMKLREEEPFDEIPDGMSQIYFTIPPWIDWNRVRMDVIDNNGQIDICWPKKGSNIIRMTVSEGFYKIRLTQYDKVGNITGLWKYGDDGWTIDLNNPGKLVAIQAGELYELNSMKYENK